MFRGCLGHNRDQFFRAATAFKEDHAKMGDPRKICGYVRGHRAKAFSEDRLFRRLAKKPIGAINGFIIDDPQGREGVDHIAVELNLGNLAVGGLAAAVDETVDGIRNVIDFEIDLVRKPIVITQACLLYTSDAADE